MKFGMLHLFETPNGRSERQMLEEQMNLMESAEGFGFDSLWPAEHHFSEYGVCGSPALNLAANARTTKKIRLGTGIVVLPLNNPLRVAEDFAMLDQLSGGRVEFGVGRGYQPIEFEGFGIDQAKSRELFDELDRLSALPEERRRLVERTNAARRLIKSYFRKTQQFCSHGFLEPEDLRSHLTMAQRLEMLFQIIEPFERARKAEYNREIFDFYDDLHRGELERPER